MSRKHMTVELYNRTVDNVEWYDIYWREQPDLTKIRASFYDNLKTFFATYGTTPSRINKLDELEEVRLWVHDTYGSWLHNHVQVESPGSQWHSRVYAATALEYEIHVIVPDIRLATLFKLTFG